MHLTFLDGMMILNTILALWRQIAIAHDQRYNFYIGLLMNITFGIGYISAGIYTGVLFTICHTMLTFYGMYCWRHK